MIEYVCPHNKCTGCGMCVNICPKHAITMKEGLHGFIFPIIDKSLCVNCGLCQRKCPSNKDKQKEENVINTYAAWNKNASVRKGSTSGGIFNALAELILNERGVVVGVEWNKEFHPQHVIIDKKEELYKLQGSKYSQSNTGNIYKQIKEYLDKGIEVLFSGTPCQNAALKMFLGKDYFNLFTMDLVCHGVPSNKMLDDYFNLFNGQIKDVKLRYKDPYWDYCFVKIDFNDKKTYQSLTIDDDYFNLFNVGYSLRESCHNCLYASTHRQSDITLADFWGYKAHSFKTRNYNKGTSLILVNSDKGNELVEKIRKKVFIENASLEQAKKGNKCLAESFKLDEAKLNEFWNDYDEGMTVHDLNVKYCANTFKIPKNIKLKRIYNKYRWIIKK